MEERSVVSATPHGPSPRSSIASVPPIPPRAFRHSHPAYNPGAIPKIPLRVPQKNPRRSLGPHSYSGVHVPSSPASTIINTGHSSPRKAESVREPDTQDEPRGEPTERQEENEWPTHQRRSRQFLVTVGVFTLIIMVGLAIGLPLGLRNKVSTQGSRTSDADTTVVSDFPAGSFFINTSLRGVNASCTSRNSTWSCDTGHPGDSETFSFNITRVDYSTYTISSKGTPFASAFANVSIPLQDYNQSTERFQVSFLTDKTVVPADAGSPTNRAAKCVYKNTKFEATLYTRKRGTTLFDTPKNQAQNSAWPGDVEIVQQYDSTAVHPVCSDSKNHLIADVQVGLGTCQCQYDNLQSSSKR